MKQLTKRRGYNMLIIRIFAQHDYMNIVLESYDEGSKIAFKPTKSDPIGFGIREHISRFKGFVLEFTEPSLDKIVEKVYENLEKKDYSLSFNEWVVYNLLTFIDNYSLLTQYDKTYELHNKKNT